jgi:hypothetical protein
VLCLNSIEIYKDRYIQKKEKKVILLIREGNRECKVDINNLYPINSADNA